MEISEVAGSSSFSRSFHSIISEKSFPSAELSLSSRNATAVSPFAQSVRINGDLVDYLSCVAYFEVKIEANLQGILRHSYYNKDEMLYIHIRFLCVYFKETVLYLWVLQILNSLDLIC